VRKNIIYLLVLGGAVMITTAIASTGLVVSAQNSNTAMANTNTSKPKPKPRRHKAKPKPAAGDTGMATTMATPRKSGRCDPAQQEQTDLSGTYTGKARHGNEAPADATLTITGNDFTMTSGSETHTGRITAVTTCGYTAVTMMMGNMAAPPTTTAPPPNPAMSLRAKKVGDKLWLTSVPGEKMSVSFTPTGAAMKPKPRRHKAKPKTTTAAPATPPSKM
jgi:hypothetical protein